MSIMRTSFRKLCAQADLLEIHQSRQPLIRVAGSTAQPIDPSASSPLRPQLLSRPRIVGLSVSFQYPTPDLRRRD